MTEITANTAFSNWVFRARTPGYLIDPVAFFIALIGGPLLVTALGFWILFVPVAALLLGGPAYLILGTPLLLIHLRRHPPTSAGIGNLAFCAVGLPFLIWSIGCLVLAEYEALWIGCFVGVLAMIFAVLWASAFAWIYRKLQRAFYARPHFH